MSQGGVFEVGVDLLDDRVAAVGLVGGDGVKAWLRSGMRRTTKRPATCSAAFRELNAVNGISATSARETHCWVVSS